MIPSWGGRGDVREPYCSRSCTSRRILSPAMTAGSVAELLHRIAEGNRLHGDPRRILDRENRPGGELQPRRPRGRRLEDRLCAVALDERDAARPVREAPEALELDAFGLPLLKDREAAALAGLARVDELPGDVEKHGVSFHFGGTARPRASLRSAIRRVEERGSR